MPRLESLRARVLAAVLVGVTLMWLVAVAGLYREARHEVDELLDADLDQVAILLLQVSHREAEHRDELREIIDREPDGHAMVFQVFDAAHTLVARSRGAPASPLVAADEAGFVEREIDHARWRIVARSDREHGVSVAVADRLDARRALAGKLGRRLATPLTLGLPLIALWLAWVLRATIAPVARLARDVDTRRGDDLSPLPERAGPSEIRPLIHAFNRLLARIGSARERERRFTADAAHELRTPLAALRVQAQVATRARDSAELHGALAAITRGIDRSTHLIEQLLMLARLEEPRGDFAPVDPAALVNTVVGEASAAALEKGVDLGVVSAPPPGATVPGQEALLSVALRNLVENAIRYTPAGGRIDVSCETHGDRLVITVADDGPGMDAAEIERACQPFFRGTAAAGTVGSGLGLSIVARIAALHGGELALRRATAGGLAVSLALPLKTLR
jgi:two-component system sensor histidine kinase QseC